MINDEYAPVALQACFYVSKLHESRTTAMLSMTAGTPRQLVMFIVNKVVEVDRRLLLSSELESIILPSGTTG